MVKANYVEGKSGLGKPKKLLEGYERKCVVGGYKWEGCGWPIFVDVEDLLADLILWCELVKKKNIIHIKTIHFMEHNSIYI